jgi:hypothetical protein
MFDMTGVDQGQYSRDEAACLNAMPVSAFGNPFASCTRDEGYLVLVSK